MKAKIYDIDGTLTKVKGDNDADDSFATYAFWPLLSYHFAKDANALRAEAEAWDKSDKGIGDDFIKSSHDMLQRGLEYFAADVNAQAMRDYAATLTQQFAAADIIRTDGIAHLRKALEQGDICILSTGSYYDGAVGFVQGLIVCDLLPADALERIIISGAMIDWDKRQVLHANIADNKIKGLQAACTNNNLALDQLEINGVYVDDPLGNDSGLCALAPDAVRVIATYKNKQQNLPGVELVGWKKNF